MNQLQRRTKKKRVRKRFLLDGMLGKLTRWLRMLGYEASYQNEQTDVELLSAATRDGLILLTSDEELYRTATFRGISTCLVKGKTEQERLAELAERFRLTLKIDTRKSRCPTCGNSVKKVPKRKVEGLVPAATFKVYNTFWACANEDCGKVYWQGSHWDKIEQTLVAARNILDSKPKPTNELYSNPRRG